jgi:flavin-dependent dehydrogenase
MRYDIAIAGAGPAGSVLAVLAARAGYRVLLVERSRFEKPRIGETAPPELRAALASVDLEHVTREDFCRAAPEVVSMWGSGEPSTRNHIFSLYGSALHLDRRAFDEALSVAARQAGADVRLGCAAGFVERPEGGYLVRLSDGGHLSCDVAILATGRTGGRIGLPYARRYLDDHVGIAGHFVRSTGAVESRTVVEAVAGGWFYCAALPDDSAIAVFVTSARLVPTHRRARLRWWLEALARSELVRRALDKRPLPGSLSVMNARGSCAVSAAGQHWIAIGDARIAPDPLSGQGIVWAIDDASATMDLIRQRDRGDLADKMNAKTARQVRDYQAQRLRVYLREQRFRSDAYWGRFS